MSRIYNAVVFFGVKIPAKISGYKEASAVFSGTHPLSEKAIKADLDVYCRTMNGYLNYNDDDAFIFIGKRIANADIDRPVMDFDESSMSPSILDTTKQNLINVGYSDKPQFYLVCDHSD